MKPRRLLALIITSLLLTFAPLLVLAEDEDSTPENSHSKFESQYSEFRDNVLMRYQVMVEKLGQAETNYVSAYIPKRGANGAENSGKESDISLWWNEETNRQINQNLTALNEDVATLFTQAMQYSSQVKVFSDLPLIRETSIQETQGEFDFRIFADGSLADIDEPVGDDLRTGGPLRYKEQSQAIEYGLKKKFVTGTEVELKQRIGGMDTNSIYFNPDDQARAGTYLTFRQPLLKGFGIDYQESPIQLARIDHAISQDELQRQVESHLLEIARAYWGLYLERAVFLQKRRLAEQSEIILSKMEGRSEIDVAPSLLARARSQAKAHELAAFQAEYAMRNAQSRIRALVNDPVFLNGDGLELVTSQKPLSQRPEESFDDILGIALLNRPEIAQGIRQIQAAAVREARSKNELRPDLDLVFDTYVKGLAGDYQYDTAYSNQFDEGRASYLLGLRFEYPLGNNSAEARNTRKRLEMRQLLRQLDVSVEHVLLEVQVSYREMSKYYESMLQSYQIMKSDKKEIDEIIARIDYLLAQGEPYGDMLYRLMDAQERLSESEQFVARSELTYNLSLYNLYRSLGILVSNSDIVFKKETDENDLPVMTISVSGSQDSNATQ